jgi:hypothetical protein
MWISTRGISQFWFQNPSKFERAGELVRKASLRLVPTSIDIS